MTRNKRYNAYSVVITHGKQPWVAFAFARQPWAIKGTTLTALRDESIYIGKYIHLNIGTTPKALHVRIFIMANELIGSGDDINN